MEEEEGREKERQRLAELRLLFAVPCERRSAEQKDRITALMTVKRKGKKREEEEEEGGPEILFLTILSWCADTAMCAGCSSPKFT